MVITTASKSPVTISAAAHTLGLAFVPPPDGAAAASPPPRATVTRPMAHQVIRGSLRWASLLATSRVNGRSVRSISQRFSVTAPPSAAKGMLAAIPGTRDRVQQWWADRAAHTARVLRASYPVTTGSQRS